MNFHDMRAIDFSHTGFHDSHMCMLGEYISSNPSLYSIVLDGNPFTDQSLSIIASALKRNKTVAHLSIKDCKEITDAGISHLLKTINENNMVLFQIDLTEGVFDPELAHEL